MRGKRKRHAGKDSATMGKRIYSCICNKIIRIYVYPSFALSFPSLHRAKKMAIQKSVNQLHVSKQILHMR